MCFGCSKEPSHRDGSFEYPHHMFWLRNKKNNFQLRTLIWRPGSKYLKGVKKICSAIKVCSYYFSYNGDLVT